jgi:hypothetical protein
MTIPGFTAESSAYPSEAIYGGSSRVARGASAAVVLPQFRSHVRHQCGPCVNGTKTCFVFGYECTVVEGTPGSGDLGIPGSGPSVRCEPEVFSETERPC